MKLSMNVFKLGKRFNVKMGVNWENTNTNKSVHMYLLKWVVEINVDIDIVEYIQKFQGRIVT